MGFVHSNTNQLVKFIYLFIYLFYFCFSADKALDWFFLLILRIPADWLEQTVQTQIRRRGKRRLIWVYTVCHTPSFLLDILRSSQMDVHWTFSARISSATLLNHHHHHHHNNNNNNNIILVLRHIQIGVDDTWTTQPQNNLNPYSSLTGSVINDHHVVKHTTEKWLPRLDCVDV